MKAVCVTLLSALAATSLASPTKTIDRRSVTGCAAFASNTEGPYVISNNLWGAGSGSGSQCYTANPLNGDSVSWSTTWTWSGGQNEVKSYANVNHTVYNTQLSSISSIPTTWQWSYSTSDIIADVSYDLFTSTSPAQSFDDHTYEFMIWLGHYGDAGPIAYGYDASGQPVPLETGLSIGGNEFDLYEGPNGATTVFSFVATSTINAFGSDIMDFIDYLTKNHGVSTSQYLLSVQAGTEAFDGSATLTTSDFSVSVETQMDAQTRWCGVPSGKTWLDVWV